MTIERERPLRVPGAGSEGEGYIELAIAAGHLPPAEREYRFHDGRKWAFDFAWPEVKVALEVEGGAFSSGRHTRGAGFERDAEKYGEAAIAGWFVLRVTTRMCEDGRATDLAARLLEARG